MPKARILIVDDDEGYLESLGMLLAAHGFETGRVTRGQQFLDAELADDWDCILLDLDLQDMTAFELLDRFPAERPLSPILLMSAAVGDWQARARGYPEILSSIPKPLAPERLLREIDRLIAARGAILVRSGGSSG